jgi:hypothetical protein
MHPAYSRLCAKALAANEAWGNFWEKVAFTCLVYATIIVYAAPSAIQIPAILFGWLFLVVSPLIETKNKLGFIPSFNKIHHDFSLIVAEMTTVGREILEIEPEKLFLMEPDTIRNFADMHITDFCLEHLWLEREIERQGIRTPRIQAICQNALADSKKKINAVHDRLLVTGMIFRWDNPLKHYFELAKERQQSAYAEEA